MGATPLPGDLLVISDSTAYFIYALVAAGFALVFIHWYLTSRK